MNPPTPPARVHRVIVEGPSPSDDSDQHLHEERRAWRRRLADAAQAALPRTWIAGLLAAWAVAGALAAIGALAATGGTGASAGVAEALPPSAALPWAAAVLALAAALVWPPVVLRRWRKAARPLAVAGAMLLMPLLSAPAWWASAAAGLALLVPGCALAVALAALAAPAGAPALVAAALPPLLALPAARAGQPLVMLAAVMAAAVAAAVALVLHRSWLRQARRGLEQDDAARSARDALEAATRGADERSRFLAVASHDLRQPVHALGLFAATLHKRLHAGPDAALARHLLGAVDALERSFNAVLDISRLDAGSVAPVLQSFPLRDLFRRLHMHYAGQAELAGLGLRLAPGGRWVTSDPQLLERMLGNLVQNAIRHTARGGVVVVARRSAVGVHIEVWDTGSGIAAGDLSRVFDEFVRVGDAPRDRSQGLGMGLAIVRRLARLLGHRLEIASAPGRGTMVRIGIRAGELPAIDGALAPADTLPMAFHEPRMVLVIDDEPSIREGLRLLLQEWGFNAVTAADAAQAEQAVQALEGRIDLVLSDVHLGGGVDGVEAVAQLRRLCGRELPAILITGDVARPGLHRLAEGADPVLFKPVQPRRLYEAMRSVLG